MSSLEDDDSTGKHKLYDARSRSALLTVALIVGACVGALVSERLYLLSAEGELAPGALAAARSRKLEIGAQIHLASTVATESTGAAGRSETARAAGAVVRSTAGAPKNPLEELLRRVAPQGEVMIAISNMNLIHEGSLQMWLKCVQKIDATNWMVVAIDQELSDHLKKEGINHYYRPVVIPNSQKDTGSNHAISAMKYEIIQEFLELGWHVLLSDVDIVTVQNPFKFLYRDSDVEGMTDGYDDPTAYGEIYGIDDASMGWSRYAQGTRHMAFNSGLFYVRASERTIDLMKRIADKLHKEKAWDQSVWNEFIFFLSHGEYRSPQVSELRAHP